MSSPPLDAAAPRQQFFESDALDRLVTMFLELATELWTTRERLYVLEREAERLGLPLRAAIEAHAATSDEQAELAAMRRRMLENIMRTLGRSHCEPPPLDASKPR
jgi:hypothetical protein